MSLENRIERLEARLSRPVGASLQVHLVFVDDCRADNEIHNEAARCRALAANPAPKGASTVVIEFVAPKEYGSSDEP